MDYATMRLDDWTSTDPHARFYAWVDANLSWWACLWTNIKPTRAGEDK